MGVEQYVMVPADAVNQIGGNNPQPVASTSQTVLQVQPKRPPGRPPRKDGTLGATDKLIKSLGIALKIALLGAYTEQNEVVDENGKAVQRSNIVDLILHALTPGSNLIGEEEFIGWLKKADIDPSLVVNETIRRRLIYGTKETSQRREREKSPVREEVTQVELQPPTEPHRQNPREPLPIREREDKETQVKFRRPKEKRLGPEFTNEDMSFAAAQPLPDNEDINMGDQTDNRDPNRKTVKRVQRPASQYMVEKKKTRNEDWDNNGND